MEVSQQSSEESSVTNPVSASPSNPATAPNVPVGMSGLIPNPPPQVPLQIFPHPSLPFAPPTSHLQSMSLPHLPMAPPSALESPIPASVLSLTPAPVKQGPRPVSSSPVPGTPWSLVWASDDRMFYFNATTHLSVWSIPSELVGNRDVESLLDNPPGGKSEHTGY